MLSVILMGFLITYAAMPDGWKWAYWANLFHYILQGLVTNELAGSDYHLDLGEVLKDVNIDNLVALDGGNATQKEQIGSILGLVSELPGGDGTNPDSGNLPALIECTLASGCFADESEDLSAGFIDCYLFSGLLSSPPCNDQFNAVMSTVNITRVLDCFGEDDAIIDAETHLKELMAPVQQADLFFVVDEEQDSSMSVQRKLFPGQNSNEPLPDDKENSLDLVLCLAGSLLPQDAVNQITDTVNDLLGIAGFVFDVVEKGIYIPGELILFVFGWANYDDGQGFTAPFKWYYCMFSVVIFLIAIEILKLCALKFIVWTKR